MTESLEINGKILYPIREAEKLISYSRDYITRLARENKIIASHIGNQWFVDLESLNSYAESMLIEQSIRKKQLSAERKREHQLEAFGKRQQKNQSKRITSLNTRALAAASFVLMFGLLTGGATYQLISFSNYSLPQVANTSSSNQTITDFSSQSKEYNGYAPAVNEPQPLVEELVQEIRPLGDVRNGILLLPSANSTSSVSSLFSDRVIILELSDGRQAVVRIDSYGNMIGNILPFVTVPVENRR